jgi:hypothetical protein
MTACVVVNLPVLAMVSLPILAGMQTPSPGGVLPVGRKQVSAVRTTETVVVDGHLDETVWRLAEPATDFVQQEPAEGRPATRQTEVRFAYNDEVLYIGAKLYDEEPERAITDELNRDFNERGGDMLGIVLDTFLDRHNSYGFLTNPGGAQREVQAFDNGEKNDPNWNGVWSVRTGLQDNCWTVEAAIPFRTLRFPDHSEQQWGLNVVRIVRRVNEVTMWAPVPRPMAQYHVGYAGVLTGLAGVRPGHNLRITPFTTAQAGRARSAAPWRGDADGGFDLKWAVTPSFVLDGTYRTDFAQVEADEQQINLTRFSQLFPEKRQFFLEAPNSFQIGLATEETGAVATALIPFFTRRIGLSESGTPIAVIGGARLTGQSGGTTVGLLNMQTAREGTRPGDNFTAVRLAHDVGRGVTLGTFYFGRESYGEGTPELGDYNRVTGADVRFSPTRVFDVEALIMRGYSDGPDDDTVRRVRARLRGNTTRATFDYLHIGDRFRHDLGFVRRRGIAMLYGEYAHVFRPRATQHWAREHTVQVEAQTLLNTGYEYVLTNQDRAIYSLGFADGGAFRLTLEHNYERALEAFSLRGFPIPAGIYEFNELVLNYSTDRSRRLSASIQRNHGDFWNGTRRRIRSGVRLRLNARLAAELDYEREAITLASGAFVADVGALRLDWSLSTRMFLDALVQYDGAREGWFSNIRFNFIHRPLSDIFIVWNEGRGAGTGNRALILKYTRALQF